ncbi:MAG: hypothetical protein ABTQ27_17580 [Amaricoccus sp.]
MDRPPALRGLLPARTAADDRLLRDMGLPRHELRARIESLG